MPAKKNDKSRKCWYKQNDQVVIHTINKNDEPPGTRESDQKLTVRAEA